MSNKEMNVASIVNGKVVWGKETFSLQDTSPTFKDFDSMPGFLFRDKKMLDAIQTVRQALRERKEHGHKS